MALIDIGSPATNRNVSRGSEWTIILKANPANASGKITSIEIWAANTLSNCKVATFYGTWPMSMSTRDYETIGTVTSGSKQTFSGLDRDVEAGDFIGIHYSSGAMEESSTGYDGFNYVAGDFIPCTNQPFAGGQPGRTLSLYGTGITILAPTVTTQACDEIETKQVDGNGTITATGGVNCTRRGFCYMEGTSGDPTTADSTAYDDGDFGTGIFSKTITGLSPDTSYRVRAYAINTAGTGYGTTVQVKTTLPEFEYVGTGTFTYSGSGSYSYEVSKWEYVGSGNFVFGGTGIYSIGFTYAGSGGLTYSGTAITTIGFVYIGSGSFVTSGSGICRYEKSEWEYAGSGSLIYSGEAIQSHTKCFVYIAGGTYNFSGVGLYSLGLSYVGIGEFVHSGSATQVYTHYYLYAGSGVFIYSGKASHRWGDWAEIGKGESNFQEVTKETSDWAKIDKEKDGWEKTGKE
ncbi:hypothetical protein ES705_30698 [subsurface metagenome]